MKRGYIRRGAMLIKYAPCIVNVSSTPTNAKIAVLRENYLRALLQKKKQECA